MLWDGGLQELSHSLITMIQAQPRYLMIFAIVTAELRLFLVDCMRLLYLLLVFSTAYIENGLCYILAGHKRLT